MEEAKTKANLAKGILSVGWAIVRYRKTGALPVDVVRSEADAVEDEKLASARTEAQPELKAWHQERAGKVLRRDWLRQQVDTLRADLAAYERLLDHPVTELDGVPYNKQPSFADDDDGVVLFGREVLRRCRYAGDNFGADDLELYVTSLTQGAVQEPSKLDIATTLLQSAVFVMQEQAQQAAAANAAREMAAAGDKPDPAKAPPVKAAAGMTPERLALLQRLVEDYPNAVKFRDIKDSMSGRLRADRALNHELQLLREMQPPLAAKADRSGYHVATEEGRKAAKKRGIGQ